MNQQPVSILFADGISAAGVTVSTAMETFYAAHQPFHLPRHFQYRDIPLGIIDSLESTSGKSRASTLLEQMVRRLPALKDPAHTWLYLGTTVGTIDMLEQAAQGEAPDCLELLLADARRLTGLSHATLVAAACASGQTAVSMAMQALRSGRCAQALVIGIDITSEFVTSGFASLRAYARGMAHPYDAHRDGLILGEGVGAVLFGMQDDGSVGRLLAAQESCDASHITSPDQTGDCLAELIQRTLAAGGCSCGDIAGVIGHGTGTLLNDASELAALAQVFPTGCPLVSIKGNTGHTLGATGVLQIAYGLEFLKRGLLPPQAGLSEPAAGAEQFVSTQPQPLKTNRLLTLNVGFGGLNSVILFEGRPRA